MAGCDKTPAPTAPSVSHALPPLDPNNVVPADKLPRAEHPTLPAGHMALPPGHGGGDPHAAGDTHGAVDPHGAPGATDQALEAVTPGDIPFDPKTVLAGVLKLDPKTKDKVKAGDVIFLVARGPGLAGAPGPVVAVRRLEAAAFPMEFRIDSRDAMMTGTQGMMKGPLVLTARVDKDGDAITKNPGDVTGTLNVKSLPSDKLALVLDTVLP